MNMQRKLRPFVRVFGVKKSERAQTRISKARTNLRQVRSEVSELRIWTVLCVIHSH